MAANPAAARVRENQRRSRARRKEYIQDLEARLQRYERHGVDVTIEVQTAARKVARQNVMLRSLLNSFGVTDAKIDEYLAYAEEHNSSPSSAPEKWVPAAAAAAAPVTSPATLPATTVPAVVPAAVPATAVGQPSPAPVHASPAPSRCCRPKQEPRECPAPVVAERVPSAAPQACSASPADSTTSEADIANNPSSDGVSAPSSSKQWSEDTTPCEEAARIIASMRGDCDEQSVRDELGCGSNKTCMVNNMTIFQVMDRG
ncbi:hypothetical protein H112_07200 [Trichophyton rubrum D6]|uniref:BZIP domain-containing protein n=4 Tax=Trichophyton TaxID=5550 RepID=A0A178F0G2_TRIRU|nr:uncharacterized protein TERG_02529 [Trichophyton rubrum CBS 118892]EZF11670.1 hypothetical protein H100_07225 [Trichophyton rubrum MR850]EZF38555.1 hypothetical protein H102_07185 [Trichophyton rubrum CBS 100081]EZF49230.1 hypothetical protein H103_07209 [Trichophyton rubrum CBS 288.86]EZF59873.1 hypothetical protein H104_07162 [Trichophyton rubrum CBS 289.86]EZF70407.1 hypothetical protein H105_07221 [Trichophyton soudanense CBS 452.61]EZF81219.1 hypothetical protein H110_07207 [Trichophy